MAEFDVKVAVASMVAEGCGVDHSRVQNDRSLVEYGLDSVRAIDLLISLEERFGVTIPEEAVRHLKTVNDIADYVQEKMAA